MNNTENPSLLEHQDRINEIDNNLIKQCISGNRRAWDTFFLLASPFIGQTIRKTLLAKEDSRNNNEEFIDMIFVQVVEELYGRRRLTSLKTPAKLKAYLRQVVRSKVNNWYRSNLSRQHISGTVAREGALSLNNAGEGNPALITFISDSEHILPGLPAGDRQNELLKIIANQWSTLLSPYDQWFLRLKAIYYIPLSNSEIEILADFSLRSPEDICRCTNQITKRLAAKDEAYGKSSEQAVTLMTIHGRLL
ncbi:MAG: hypothetical protein DRH04_00215, partial [Deltaproteobacteria bacterium]